MAAEEEDRVPYTEEDAIADFNDLKSTVVNDDNIQQIQDKLVLTRDYRLQILLNMDTDLLENFPYFFINPGLVRVDLFYSIASTKVICYLENAFFYRFYSISLTIRRLMGLIVMHWLKYGQSGRRN